MCSVICECFQKLSVFFCMQWKWFYTWWFLLQWWMFTIKDNNKSFCFMCFLVFFAVEAISLSFNDGQNWVMIGCWEVTLHLTCCSILSNQNWVRNLTEMLLAERKETAVLSLQWFDPMHQSQSLFSTVRSDRLSSYFGAQSFGAVFCHLFER